MKFENLDSDLFTQFKESRLADISKVVGGEKTCTDNADGGTCTDNITSNPSDFVSDCDTEYTP